MKKEIISVLVGYGMLVVVGTFVLNTYDQARIERAGPMRPEGYQQPESLPATGHRTVPDGVVRVSDLEVADDVQKYLDHTLELVAMSPGSGWMRLKTTDGISPIISFDGVRPRDIEQFNRFARQIDEPIRVALYGNTLQVFAEETEAHLARFEGRTPRPIKMIGFYKPRTDNARPGDEKRRGGSDVHRQVRRRAPAAHRGRPQSIRGGQVSVALKTRSRES